ncbi:uncharacterized protein BJ212DRAFT_1282423, partial [Suillus subaureus]
YDTINTQTHPDVMVLSRETKPQHPYWYAHILGIYHMDIWFNTEGSMKMCQIKVLYIRWLAPLIGHQSRMNYTQLLKVAFVDESDHDVFGFLDPGQVIQGTHLIPAFVSGCGTVYLCHGKPFAHQGDDLDDWEAYYVGM